MRTHRIRCTISALLTGTWVGASTYTMRAMWRSQVKSKKFTQSPMRTFRPRSRYGTSRRCYRPTTSCSSTKTSSRNTKWI
uniref:Putative secreted protein n=1 Tax=Anopheles darlingi TaxID=43151 RepID=A0A2M4DI67_ANODA